MTTIYQFSVEKQDGTEISLENYQGKVLLIVNTATGCGLTPQYQGLQKLYDTYQKDGFEILDFPCNQFHRQAPGSAEDINSFCSLHYQTSFPRFQKIDVNGPQQSSLYKWLKQEKGGLLTKDIKWNFTKFLINRQGQVVKRYAPQVKPETIEKDLMLSL